MLKTFAIVSALAVILLTTIGDSMHNGSVLALSGPSPDQSTGPYNPGLPQDDAATRSG